MSIQQMDERYAITVQQIKELVTRGKADDAKALFSLVGKVLKMVESRAVSEGVQLGNAQLEVFDDLIAGKSQIPLGKALQLVLVELYKTLLLPSAESGATGAPGYVVRNIVTAAVSTMTSSKAPATAREVSTAVVGEILAVQALMCGSMLSEVIAASMKMVRGSDTMQRVIALRTCAQIVIGGAATIGDTHADIVKQAAKAVADKHPDVRMGVAGLLAAVACNSEGCTTVSTDVFLAACAKGLEDDIGTVQEAFASTVAKVFYEQILAYGASQAETRAGKNRGGANEDSAPGGGKAGGAAAKAAPRRSILPSMLSGTAKKIAEEYDLKSVVQGIMRTIVKSHTPSGNLRAGYIAVLGFLLRDCMQSEAGMSPEEQEWVVPQLFMLLHSSEALGLATYDELAFFRLRISHLFRFALILPSGESGLKSFAASVITFTTGTIESRSEAEIQVALTELAHILLVMGDAAASVQDDVVSAVGGFLKDISFGVRSAAAHVLTSLATVVPALAAGLLSKSLAIARMQVQELVMFGDNIQSQAERMQRMFTFHGHALVISNFLKAEEAFPTGLPSPLILSVFDFGLDLLSVDVLSAPLATRNITCSLVRAGSLIVSSCLHKGYKSCKTRMADLVDIYDLIFKSITALHGNNGKGMGEEESSSNPFDAADAAAPQKQGQDETLYEMMYMEAALVCLSSLLWSCPEALLYEENCLSLVTDGLENAFRIAKGKYQPKFKTHFRFRTLHAILLECFAWLPPGSFPNVSQPVYMESLRVLRDCIASGHECGLIGQYSGDKDAQHILGLGNNGLSVHSLGGAASMSSYMMGSSSTVAGGKGASGSASSVVHGLHYLPSYPHSEMVLLLKLELYANVLSKKENEASLAVFSRDMALPTSIDIFGAANSIYSSRLDWQQPQAPCVQLDGRLIDAAITLLAATFPHQPTELQERSVQLCGQAIDQFVKQVSTSTLSMFSSEDEKKKRDKKAFVTIKTVACTLAAIVKAFPVHHGMTLEEDLPWGQSLLDMLKDMLCHYNAEVQHAAAQAMALFSSKITGSDSHIAETLVSELSMELGMALNKDNKVEDMSSYCGHMLCLSSLFMATEISRKKNSASTTNRSSEDDSDDVRLHVMATIFDCLRKTDTSLIFRSYAVYALGIILRGCVEFVSTTSSGDPAGADFAKSSATRQPTLLESISAADHQVQNVDAELMAFIDRVWQAIELHLGAIQSWEESELILTNIQRLVNVIVPITLKHVPSKALVNHFFVIWTCIRNSSRHPTLHRECAKFLSTIGTSMKMKNNADHVSRVVHLLRRVYLNPADNDVHIGASVLREVIPLLRMLISQCPHVLYEQQIDVLLFNVLDWCSAHTALPLRSSYLGVEVRTTYLLKGLDSVSSDMFYLKHELSDCLRALALAHVSQDNNKHIDVRAIRWVLYCRAVALSLKSEAAPEAEPDPDEPDGGEPSPEDAATGAKSKDIKATAISLSRFCAMCRDAAAGRAAGLPAPRMAVKRVAVDVCVDILSHLINIQQRLSCGIPLKTDCFSAADRKSALLAHTDVLVGRTRTRTLLLAAAQNAANAALSAGVTTISTATAATTDEAPVEDESAAIYAEVPCYASLFIHDLVNASCACATFTLDDKLCLNLQMASIQFVENVVSLFCKSFDPDDHADETANTPSVSPARPGSVGASMAPDSFEVKQTPILTQFSSQLISALRPCLAVTKADNEGNQTSRNGHGRRGSGSVTVDSSTDNSSHGFPNEKEEIASLVHGFFCPPLMDVAGRVVSTLLMNSIVTDLVAVKRLVRLLLAFVQPPGQDMSGGLPQRYLARASLQAELSDSLSLRGHISIACNIARLVLLSAPQTAGFVNSNECPAAVSTAIQALLLEPNIPAGDITAQAAKNEPNHIEVTRQVWRAICIDAARLLQKSDAEGLPDFEKREDHIAAAALLPPPGEYLPPTRRLGTSSFSSGISRSALCLPHPLPKSWSTGQTVAVLVGPGAIAAGVNPTEWAAKNGGVSGSSSMLPGAYLADAWPVDDPTSDARRGGATYGIMTDPHTLRSVYNDALPLCLAAYASSKSDAKAATGKDTNSSDGINSSIAAAIIESDRDSDEAIFAITLCALQQEAIKMPDSPAVGYILSTLQALAAADVGLDASNEKSRAQWARLLLYLETKLLPTLLNKAQKFAATDVVAGIAASPAALGHLMQIAALLQALPFRAGTLEAQAARALKAAESTKVLGISAGDNDEANSNTNVVSAETETSAAAASDEKKDVDEGEEEKSDSDTPDAADEKKKEKEMEETVPSEKIPSEEEVAAVEYDSDDPFGGLSVSDAPLPALQMTPLDMSEKVGAGAADNDKGDDTSEADADAGAADEEAATKGKAGKSKASKAETKETGCELRDPLWRCACQLLAAVKPEQQLAVLWDPTGSLSRQLCGLLRRVAAVELEGHQVTRARYALLVLCSMPALAARGAWQGKVHTALAELSAQLNTVECAADSSVSNASSTAVDEVCTLLTETAMRSAAHCLDNLHGRDAAAAKTATDDVIASIDAWAFVAVMNTNSAPVAPPATLSALLLQAYSPQSTRKEGNWVLAAAILVYVLKYCKLNQQSAVSRSLLAAVHPAVVHMFLSSSALVPTQTQTQTSAAGDKNAAELTALQLLFFSLNMADEAISEALGQLIPAICALLQRPASSDPTLKKLAGQGIVHIARTHVEPFRAQVALLKDAERLILQEAMRDALMATQQQQAASPAPAGAPGGLKIDMSKFKK